MEDDDEKKEINVSENEKKKIFNKIVSKSLLCPKATVDLANKIIDNIVSMNRAELFKLTEGGLPDDLPELRSLIWKINLDYLPSDWNHWNQYLEAKGQLIKNIEKKFLKI